MTKSKKQILSIICMALVFAVMMPFSAFAGELKDGAYLIGRKTSYVNPDTGKTEDGGTNIALGESMCSSIIDDQMLVEKSNGKTYVTIGVGLMSNVESVKIKVQDKNGKYRDAKITKTGSCKRDGDTCNHYRFEVYSEDKKISPVLFVTPMGREVQFFVVPDVKSAKEGTGNFVSEMVKEKSQETTAPAETTTETTTEQVTETTTALETTTEVAAETEETKSNSKTPFIIGGVVAVVVIGAGVGYFCFYKKKKGKEKIDEN